MTSPAHLSNLPATERLMARLDALALHTDEPGKLTRLYLSPAHKAAIATVMAWFSAAGLDPVLDAIGNVSGRLEGATPGLPAVLIGSHIDTVRDAGKYDGNLGVLAGLSLIEEIRREGIKLPFAIELVAFGDEEGVRFPITLSGSRALAGKFEDAALEATDADGIPLRAALAAFGLEGAGVARLARKPLAYLEMHIEQGPVLEAQNQPVGIVSGIASIQRFKGRLLGEAGHAGTVPMAYRKDALAGVAQIALAVERIAQDLPGMVGTIGQIEALPGAVNVIPGEVRFSLDLRGPDDETRKEGVARVLSEMESIAQKRGLTLEISAGYEEKAALAHPEIQNGLASAIRAEGFTPVTLPSGAGHDAMVFDGVCPMGMLFVRCKGGISHNPAESMTAADADVALRVMLRFLKSFSPQALQA